MLKNHLTLFKKVNFRNKLNKRSDFSRNMTNNVSKSPFGSNEKGEFVRETSIYRNWIQSNTEFPPEANRYHLYVSYACPWASRCVAMRYLKGLEDIIGLSVVHPVFNKTRPNDPNDTHLGWFFIDPKVKPFVQGPTGLGSYSSEGSIPDTINNCNYVRDLYELSNKGTEIKATRYTIPILWDCKQSKIVSNESSDIIRMFNTEFNDLINDNNKKLLNYYPSHLQKEIDNINDWIYNDISNGVYKCGFATSQNAYDEASTKLFQALDKVEEILSKKRYLLGGSLTEADIRLFMTLIRFDEVYVVHFKTNKKNISNYKNIFNYVRELYQIPEIKKSVHMDHIKIHYYGSHTHLNTYGVIPAGPNINYNEKHDRERLPKE